MDPGGARGAAARTDTWSLGFDELSGAATLKRDALGSVLGVTAQMVNILTEQNVQASLASLRPNDILIEPELGDFSAADFGNLGLTIPISRSRYATEHNVFDAAPCRADHGRTRRDRR